MDLYFFYLPFYCRRKSNLGNTAGFKHVKSFRKELTQTQVTTRFHIETINPQRQIIPSSDIYEDVIFCLPPSKSPRGHVTI